MSLLQGLVKSVLPPSLDCPSSLLVEGQWYLLLSDARLGLDCLTRLIWVAMTLPC